MAPPYFSSAVEGDFDNCDGDSTYLGSGISQKIPSWEPEEDRGTIGRRQCPAWVGGCGLSDVRRILPSLYPCYLPYQAQHIVLTSAQSILEACCFDFARRKLPNLVLERAWECASAVELSQWTIILTDGSLGRPHLMRAVSEHDLQTLMMEVRNLRDAAVYRARITARSISQLLRYAHQLTEILGDQERAGKIGCMKGLVDKQIYALEQQKKSLESAVSSKLHTLTQQHTALSQQKVEVISNMLQLDTERQVEAGTTLQHAIEDLLFDDQYPGQNWTKPV